jgi:glycerol-3-phosphate dehydrogenase
MLRNGPGRDFGQGLTEAELRWLVEHEWARTIEDVLWRRTKLGLRATPAEAKAVADYLAGFTRSAPVPAGAANPQAARTAYR